MAHAAQSKAYSVIAKLATAAMMAAWFAATAFLGATAVVLAAYGHFNFAFLAAALCGAGAFLVAGAVARHSEEPECDGTGAALVHSAPDGYGDGLRSRHEIERAESAWNRLDRWQAMTRGRAADRIEAIESREIRPAVDQWHAPRTRVALSEVAEAEFE